LQAVADNARISQQASHISLSESRHFSRVEVLERLSEVVSLAQDDDPAQPRLKALQDQHLEDLPILMDRHTPLLVMILTVQRILPTPPTPRLSRARTPRFSVSHAVTLPERYTRGTVDFSHEEAYKDTAMKPFT